MRKRIVSLVLALLLFVGLCPGAVFAAGTVTYSDALVSYIKYCEGFSPTLYKDTGGWCIGYGCIVDPEDYPNGISEPEAEALLREKMDLFAYEVRRFLNRYGVGVTQGQFDAMCSMTYNLGPYWLNASYTLPGMIIRGAHNYSEEEIVSAFAAWCHVSGNVHTAILNRRIVEAKMFLYDEYSTTSAGWNWLVCYGNGGNVSQKINCFKSGQPYGKLPTASRGGYTFVGWETQSGALIKSGTVATQNHFVNAKWQSNAELENGEEWLPVPSVDLPGYWISSDFASDMQESEEKPVINEPVAEEPAVEIIPAVTPAAKPEIVYTAPAAQALLIAPAPESQTELSEEEQEPAEETEEWKNCFSDLRPEAWYYDYAASLAEAGVISGYPDGSFRPGNYVTWAEALKTLTIASGFPAIEAEEDEDADEEETPEHWAQAYLDFALKKGFLESAEGIELDAQINRNQAAALFASFLELEADENSENPFADSDDPNAVALYHIGIVDGSLEEGQRYFKGGDNIKRSELCKLLSLTMDHVAENFVCIMGDRAKINFDLPMNVYDSSRFITRGDRIYYGDNSMDIRYGVDVSQHQYDIDWKALAADGFDYAIIRVGYRGYTEGKMSIDPYFEENMKGAADAGLDVGVYFFSQATSVEEGVEEAEFLLEAIEGYEINYPVVFDWEPMFLYNSRTLTYDGDTVTDASIAFMERVAQAGYTPMTYYNKSIAYLKLDLEKLDGYHVWLAQYATDAPDYIYHFDMWQYGTAKVAGVEGECDVNISFRDFAKVPEEAH